MESEEHHSRWFLTQLVTSVALTGHAPYKDLKTQGHLVDDQQDPYYYVQRSHDIDVSDLIEGTVKMDGQRKHGYGLDTMRSWAITIDQDRSYPVSMESIDKANQ